MIWCPGPKDKPYPAVTIHRIDAPDYVHVQPEVQYHYNYMDLMVVRGRIYDPDDARRALQVASEWNGSSIKIAVMSRQSDRSNDLNRLCHLQEAFSAVFVVDENNAEDVVQRIARAIIKPGSAYHHACFDFNDMFYIVTSGRKTSPARFGTGKATGPDAAKRAVDMALNDLGATNQPIGNCNFLFFVSLSKGMPARSNKEVSEVIRQHAGENSCFGSGLGIDESLEPNTVEVDILCFGVREPDLRPNIRLERRFQDDEENGPKRYDIPMFLRNKG